MLINPLSKTPMLQRHIHMVSTDAVACQVFQFLPYEARQQLLNHTVGYWAHLAYSLLTCSIYSPNGLARLQLIP